MIVKLWLFTTGDVEQNVNHEAMVSWCYILFVNLLMNDHLYTKGCSTVDYMIDWTVYMILKGHIIVRLRLQRRQGSGIYITHWCNYIIYELFRTVGETKNER